MTPKLDESASSNDDFKSCRENISPKRLSSPLAAEASPGTQENPTRLVEYSDSKLLFSLDEEPQGNVIPPPPTRSKHGKLLKWESLDLAFKAL